MAQIMEMKKELDYLKIILELMKQNEKLKKENEELLIYKQDALLIYKPEWSYFEGKKLEAWTEYVTEYGWAEELEIRQEEFEEQYEEEESDDEEEEDDGCSYNFYICRYCFAFGTDDPDCSKCGRKMCVLLHQEKNAALALIKAKQY